MNHWRVYGAGVLMFGSLWNMPVAPAWEDYLDDLWKNAMLPWRIAQLAAQPADEDLVMPVEGTRVRDIEDTWHALRSGGRLHEGQDIFAARGTPVYSATDGYVLFIGEQRLGGQAVVIVGAGGRRYYYSHLDSLVDTLARGDHVSTETMLGTVGNTGNAQGTPPHLHLGVYGSAGAIDPLPLLRDRQ